LKLDCVDSISLKLRVLCQFDVTYKAKACQHSILKLRFSGYSAVMLLKKKQFHRPTIHLNFIEIRTGSSRLPNSYSKSLWRQDYKFPMKFKSYLHSQNYSDQTLVIPKGEM